MFYSKTCFVVNPKKCEELNSKRNVNWNAIIFNWTGKLGINDKF